MAKVKKPKPTGTVLQEPHIESFAGLSSRLDSDRGRLDYGRDGHRQHLADDRPGLQWAFTVRALGERLGGHKAQDDYEGQTQHRESPGLVGGPKLLRSLIRPQGELWTFIYSPLLECARSDSRR
jgi:hypothetical protein